MAWELRIERLSQQTRESRTRTVGRYEVWRDGVQATEPLLSGTTAETRWPGDNSAAGIDKRCILVGSYPLYKSDGPMYVTDGYLTEPLIKKGMPGIQIGGTGARSDVLIHPGKNSFLSSTGCINLCTSLPDKDEKIDFMGSRRRVIALIEDIKAYLGDSYPAGNQAQLPGVGVIIQGGK